MMTIKIAGNLLCKPGCDENAALSGAFMLGCSGRLIDEDVDLFDAILKEHGLTSKENGGPGWGLNKNAMIPTGYTAE